MLYCATRDLEGVRCVPWPVDLEVPDWEDQTKHTYRVKLLRRLIAYVPPRAQVSDGLIIQLIFCC
jgi:hypothetical protein